MLFAPSAYVPPTAVVKETPCRVLDAATTTGPSMSPSVCPTPTYFTMEGMQVQGDGALQYYDIRTLQAGSGYSYYDLLLTPSTTLTPVATAGEEEADVDKDMSALYELLCPGSSLPRGTTMMDTTTATEHLPQMATAQRPVSPALSQGTMMMATTTSTTTTSSGSSLLPMAAGSGPSSGLLQMGTVPMPAHPILPQKATVQHKRGRGQEPAMDAEQKKKRRLEVNKLAARMSRQNKKDYVASLESSIKAMVEDKKELIQRLQYLEHVCRTHGVSPP